MSERVQKVLANCDQGLNSTEKAQARRNIDAQASLTAGENIRIVDNTISATNTAYSAGSGISISNDTIANTAPNVKSDWNAATGSSAEILNKPTIPTVNDGTLTIQKNGTAVATFSANQSSAATANITVPTDTSDLTNGAGFITASQIPAQVNADWNASSGAAQILNKPAIPTVNDGTLTIQVNGTQLATFSANQSGNTTANITGVGGTDIVTRTNGQGGYVETSVSKLTLDTDFNQILTDGNQIGVYAPTPTIAATDKVLTVTAGGDAPMWMDTPSNAEFIQFTYGNTTTAQDTVYTAVENAYTAGKLPVLYCGVANATLYWFPTANGANGYSFARTVSNYSYVVTIDAFTHVISHQSKEIINYTAGTNVQIDANNQISATDTTYSAGSYINIDSNNVISNTMHQDTYGLMISYNTLGNSGTTTHSIGPWRIQVTKAAMAAWDSTTNNYSLHIAFAHQDYLDDSIVNGRILVDTLTPWADGAYSTVYIGHNQWGFTGGYTQGGSNTGFGLQLISPDSDPDGNARACPKTMRGYHFVVNCGINSPDWLECDASLLYVNNNTSLTSNAARLLLRFKYFYV